MPHGLMLQLMDSKEMVYWVALYKLEQEERLQREAARRTESEAERLKAARVPRNRSR